MNIKLIMENWNKFLNEKVDHNNDNKNNFDDVKIARMKASGMSDAEIKKKHPELFNESEEEPIEEPIEEAEEGVFAPNHYCIHHGGIQHEGKIIEAEAVRHMEPDSTGFVSHYDMKLPNGKIIENVAAEDIQVTKASLLNEHGDEAAPGKRHKKMKKIKEKKCPSCKKSPCEC